MARGSGFTAMCAYRADLGNDALAEVATVHPLVRGPEGVPPFQVFHDEARVVLTGSVDTFTADRLGRVLADSPAARPSAVLDLSLLEFVDVAGCRAVARWAQGLGRTAAGDGRLPARPADVAAAGARPNGARGLRGSRT